MFALDFLLLRRVLQIGVALGYMAILWRKRAREFGTFFRYIRINPFLCIMEIFLILEWLRLGNVLNTPLFSINQCVVFLGVQGMLGFQAIQRQGAWRKFIVIWTLFLTILLCVPSSGSS